jgi:hypothetical protein
MTWNPIDAQTDRLSNPHIAAVDGRMTFGQRGVCGHEPNGIYLARLSDERESGRFRVGDHDRIDERTELGLHPSGLQRVRVFVPSDE